MSKVKSRLRLSYQGNTYISTWYDGSSESLKDTLFEDFERLNKFTVALEGGGYMIIGEGVIQNSVLIISEEGQ